MTSENLIRRGYFPIEITPNFTTASFADNIVSILPSIDVFDPIDHINPTTGGYVTAPKKIKSKYTDFTIPKIGQFRRRLGIPNPIHQLRLSNTISSNWAAITRHTERSNYSLFRLVTNTSQVGRSLEFPIFEDLTKEKILRSVDSKYLLRLDIAKFYNSIYTHSIPWALHTKTVAKRLRQRQSFGNAIDQDSQKIQDGQTMGIPIGPDTSRIISEIIASTIDVEIQKAMPGIKAIRVVDDYYVYVNTLSEIEKFSSVIQQQLRLYELDINIAKQKIINMPDTLENSWLYILSDFRFGEKPKTQRKDLIQFFDQAFRLSKEFPEDYVLRYATSRIRKVVFHKSNIDLLTSFLLKCINVEPKTIPYVAENLVAYFTIDSALLNLHQIEKSLNENLFFNIGLENHFEVSWLTWLLKRLGLKMAKGCSDNIGKIDNPIVALDVLSMRNTGLILNPIDTSIWESSLTKDGLYSENWLVSYEAIIKGWLSPATPYLNTDPFFEQLQKLKVSFYDETRDIVLNQVKAIDNSYLVMA